jgi:hypothetical protein
MTLLQLLNDSALATGTATLLYTATITLTAITALAAPSADRRRAAREVLTALLRRSCKCDSADS